MAEHEFDIVASDTVYVGNILALRVDEVAMPGGRTGRREVVEHYGAVGRNLLGLVGGWWQCASDSPEAFVAMVRALRQAAGPTEQFRAGNPASKALLDPIV